MTYMVRQGDVLLVATTKKIDAEVLPPDGDRVVLAHGEVTGHAHVLPARNARAVGAGVMQIMLDAQEALTHEEHAEIKLPGGLYDIPKQVEETPEVIRRVVD